MNADYQLIRSAKSGDLKAAETIIRKYYANVFDYCKYHSANIQTAEDITQDVFLTLLSEIHRYRHRGKLLNYLYAIARNKCTDERKRMRNTDVSIEDMTNKLESTDAGDEMDKMYVKEAVESLPDEIRDVVILYYYFDKKQKEIAEICGIGLPLVKYRLKRGKELIKRYLEGEA